MSVTLGSPFDSPFDDLPLGSRSRVAQGRERDSSSTMHRGRRSFLESNSRTMYQEEDEFNQNNRQQQERGVAPSSLMTVGGSSQLLNDSGRHTSTNPPQTSYSSPPPPRGPAYKGRAPPPTFQSPPPSPPSNEQPRTPPTSKSHNIHTNLGPTPASPLHTLHDQPRRESPASPPVPPLPPFGPPAKPFPLRALREDWFAIKTLTFGVLDRNGVYIEDINSHCRDAYIALFKRHSTKTIIGVDISGTGFNHEEVFCIKINPSSIVNLVGGQGQLIFELAHSPQFEVSLSSSTESFVRVSAFDERHEKVSSFVSKTIRIELTVPDQLKKLVEELVPALSIRPVPINVRVKHQHLYSDSHFPLALNSFPIPVAFQIDAIIYDGTAFPFELREVEDFIVAVVSENGPRFGERMLIGVRRWLKNDLFARRKKWLAKEPAQPFRLIEMLKELRELVLGQIDILPDPRKNQIFLRRVIVTPTSKYLEGPAIEQSNAKIRRYGDNTESFIRVTFAEEDRTKLITNSSYPPDRRHFLVTTVHEALTTVLDLCGRLWDMLAFSNSGLRSLSVYFVTPFSNDAEATLPMLGEDDGLPLEPDNIDAATIRADIGTMPDINTKPALMAARIGQPFSTSHPTIMLSEAQVFLIEDIETIRFGRVVSCHTDGAGIMSEALRDLVWEVLLLGPARKDCDRAPPDVFQFRLAGAKGIIVVDPSLTGVSLGLPPSVRKFNGAYDDLASRSYMLNIIQWYLKPTELFSNRPLISALEDLKINKSVFEDLMSHELKAIRTAKKSLLGCAELLRSHSLGTSCQLDSLLKRLDRVLKPSAFQGLLRDEPYLAAAINSASAKVHHTLKAQASIRLEGSVQLVGVPDRSKVLQPDEIFVAIMGDDGEEKSFSGKVAITRSPTMDPGDIRIVYAVEPEELVENGPRNCVVLPTTGERSLASMMGGGDVDGDEYQLILDEKLIPDHEVAPLDHTPVEPLTLESNSTIQHIANWFVQYACTDNLGRVAHTHLAQADSQQQHGNSSTCKRLAAAYSIAVDYTKLGNQGDVPQTLRESDTRRRPDFMSRDELTDETYESRRALGALYRKVDKGLVALPLPQDTFSELYDIGLSPTLRVVVEDVWAGAGRICGQHILNVSDEEKNELNGINNDFLSQFVLYAELDSFPRRAGSTLDELEVFLNTINAKPSDRDKRGRDSATNDLRDHLTSLVDALEAIYIEEGARASKVLHKVLFGHKLAIGLEQNIYGARSLKLILLNFVLEILSLVETNGTSFIPRPPPSPNTYIPTDSLPPPQVTYDGEVYHGPKKPQPSKNSGTKRRRQMEREMQSQAYHDEWRRIALQRTIEEAELKEKEAEERKKQDEEEEEERREKEG